MSQLHLFTMKEYITSFHLACREVEATVDEWIAENDISDLRKTAYVEFSSQYNKVLDRHFIGFEAATYGFYNELDALQFQLTFGENFDYCVIDRE